MSRSAFAPRLSTGRAMRSLVEDAQDDHPQVAEPPVRRALEVGAADDRAEREADAVAEQVLARIGGGTAVGPVECSEHSTAHVHRKLTVGAAEEEYESEAEEIAAQVSGAATRQEVRAQVRARLAEESEGDEVEDSDVDAVVELVYERIEEDEAGESETEDEVHRSHADTAPAGRIGAAGGALDQDASSRIESARGGGSTLDPGVRREMEAGFGQSLGDVRIHTDSRADQLSRQMSARAFTTGRDIFFARGEYDPTSAPGRHTLAHELAHTVQEGSTARRKLRGTAEALASQGGEKTSGKLRKVTGNLTHWDKIVGGVRAYEAEEATLMSGGKNPDPMTLMSAKPGLLKLLTKVQGYVKDWRKANDSAGQDETFDKSRWHKGKKKNKQTGEITEYTEQRNATSDSRSKSGRRQAVAMLEPRVGNEINLLSAKDSQGWMNALGLSTQQVTGSGKDGKGQVNETKELHYRTEQGDFSGYFKQDLGFNPEMTPGEQEVGIRQVDPNYGARTVALYRLDQLFDAQVTARAEFGVHQGPDGKSRMGTVLESAKGVSMDETRLVRSGDKVSKGGEVSIDDPALQRGLNKLQLLDAIAGQLDRHGGNYKINQDDDGRVTGVTGIDLDMGFGKSMDKTNRFDSAFNYKGLPDFIDAKMGQKILQVKAGDIRDALTGLLSKTEIDATISRFLEVQEAVRTAEKSGRLRDDWDETTGRGGMSWEQAAKGGHQSKTSYQDNLRNEWRWRLEKEIAANATEELRRVMRTHPTWQEMPKLVEDTLISIGNFTDKSLFQFDWYHKSPIVVAAMRIVFENDLANDRADDVTAAVISAMLDRMDANKIAIQFQENTFNRADLAKQMTEAVQADLPRLQQRFKR